MGKRILVTIGRQFGSGGHEIGHLLAERLNAPLFDKELLELSAQKSGMSPELFENNDERPINSLLYSLSINPYAMGHIAPPDQMPIPQKLFLAQFDTIRSLADEGDCIFVGRCADYVLRDHPSCVNIFVHSPLEVRVERVKARLELSSEEARNLILKTDKKRSAYYNSYADRRWGAIENYHLAFDSSKVTFQQSIAVILSYMGIA